MLFCQIYPLFFPPWSFSVRVWCVWCGGNVADDEARVLHVLRLCSAAAQGTTQ